MYRIGEAKGIKLYAPNDAYFSYFNSPYFGHAHSSAIDIYPYHQEWGGPVLSPISGKIVRIQKTAMGLEKVFPTEDYDFGIAIQPEASDDKIVRILHCKPTLQEGHSIEIGDMIGTTIRSRYFNYWTGAHYHVEVMKLDSFQRSSKSFALKIPFRYEAKRTKNLASETEFIVDIVNDNHIIGFPRKLSHAQIGSYTGLSATDGDSRILGILDGGISHYKHGGVVGHERVDLESSVSLQNHTVGVIHSRLEFGSFFFRGPSISSYIDGTELRGLSCFIYPKEYKKQGIPPLVLVPKYYQEFVEKISEGDVCTLTLESPNNTVKANQITK